MSTYSASSTPQLQKYGLLIPQILWPWISSATAGLVSYRIRHWNLKYRWIIGIGVIKLNNNLTNYTNEVWKQILPSYITSGHWLMINNIFGMMWGSTFCGFFGGKRYFNKHGIDSYSKALISAACSGQVYFRHNQNAHKKAFKNLLRITGYLGLGFGIAKVIRSELVSAELIEENVVLHMETLGLFASCMVFGSNTAANVHYLIFGGNDDMDVIEPYDFVYLSKSIREFW